MLLDTRNWRRVSFRIAEDNIMMPHLSMIFCFSGPFRTDIFKLLVTRGIHSLASLSANNILSLTYSGGELQRSTILNPVPVLMSGNCTQLNCFTGPQKIVEHVKSLASLTRNKLLNHSGSCGRLAPGVQHSVKQYSTQMIHIHEIEMTTNVNRNKEHHGSLRPPDPEPQQPAIDPIANRIACIK
jgi:hypothetical protein